MPQLAYDRLGSTYLGEGDSGFLVWAPRVERMELVIVEPNPRVLPMQLAPRGYFHAVADGVGPGARYVYRLDGKQDRPDPASRFQPEGPHGPSEVVDLDFDWQGELWQPPALSRWILYELHVGTFTPEGTFEAVIGRLDELAALGVTAVELMPVAQFPGERNWGYDGTFPFAAQNSYGGPDSLRRLVDACHRRGLAVVLDVVYNHFGPEGNYLGEFGHYFTGRYRTPWGMAINFDGADSDHVRRYFIENALWWLADCRIDALRLDAIHAITDFSSQPFLEDLAVAVRECATALNRRLYLVAESDLNDSRVIRPRELGGYGLDAQWSDDLHHALHALVTGQRDGYYEDFGKIEHLARAYRHGFVYSGQYSAHRRRRHGNSTRLNSADQFVVGAQNHDQVGNRLRGERLSQLVEFEQLKLAAGAVLVSPYLPLLFMGEEYGEIAPFQYFTSHADPALAATVRQGRSDEFNAFAWDGDAPDPQDAATFERSKLRWELREQGQHRVLLEFYQELIRLRVELPALACLNKDQLESIGFENRRLLYLRRWTADDQVFILFNFGRQQASAPLGVPAGRWHKELDSAEPQWLGPGGVPGDELVSSGELEVALGPLAFAVFRLLDAA